MTVFFTVGLRHKEQEMSDLDRELAQQYWDGVEADEQYFEHDDHAEMPCGGCGSKSCTDCMANIYQNPPATRTER